MTSDLRVVSPYRPFVAESHAHHVLGPFDWVGALQMLAVSVRQSNDCETVAITDVDTDLPVPAYRYATVERRLMLWILEVAGAYLQSADFDRDTIMCSPDLLVFGDLRPWMTDHFTVLMRSGYPAHPILNGVQFWPVRKKQTLVHFYAQALAIGRTLPEGYLRWGGDTEPLRQLLAPLAPGLVIRGGKPIARLLESDELMQAFTSGQAVALSHGIAEPPVRAVLDFRYVRKRSMRQYFEATIGHGVAS